MQSHPYFQSNRLFVLAHRGQSKPTENTLEAFKDALAAGVDYLETDIRTTKDQVAVLHHDKDLKRLTSLDIKISEITWPELQKLQPAGGGTFTSLQQALVALPQAKFNLDIKDQASILATVRVIEKTKCHQRVLVSSFSNRRRKAALKLLSLPVATSSSASTVIQVWLIVLLHLPQSWIEKSLKGIGAMQIPRKQGFINLDKARFINSVLASGTQIHYWTINSPEEMLELTRLGATGIVTDVPELAVHTLRKA